MGKVTLVTGGARCGKSAWALQRANGMGYQRKIFIATAEAIDDEMRSRISRHRSERGEGWRTIEEPRNVAAVIRSLDSPAISILDCCTVWLGNIWHCLGGEEAPIRSAVEELAGAIDCWKSGAEGEMIVVSNEVGWGIVPADPSVRLFRDFSGRLNREIAAIADEVFLCVAGIAIRIKPCSERVLNE